MTRSIAICRTIVIAAGVVQLILGMLFWAGIGKVLVPLHMVIGTILAVSLLILGIQALRARAPRGLAVLTIVWAIVVPAVGSTQTHLLVGSLHWIVQAIHLLLGVAAMGLASILAGKVLPSQPKATWDEPDTAAR